MNPALPIFIVEELDIAVFDSVEDAQRFLEPWSVKEDEGKIFDADGRLMNAEADDIHVTLSLAEDEPSHAHELEDFLRRYLRAIGEPIADKLESNLRCLVDACRRRA